MSDIRRMQLGQVVDFVVTYNERMSKSEQAAQGRRPSKPARRKATQADIDAFFG